VSNGKCDLSFRIQIPQGDDIFEHRDHDQQLLETVVAPIVEPVLEKIPEKRG